MRVGKRPGPAGVSMENVPVLVGVRLARCSGRLSESPRLRPTSWRSSDESWDLQGIYRLRAACRVRPDRHGGSLASTRWMISTGDDRTAPTPRKGQALQRPCVASRGGEARARSARGSGALVLCEMANGAGYYWASVSTLQRETGYSRAVVYRALARLRSGDDPLIEVYRFMRTPAAERS